MENSYSRKFAKFIVEGVLLASWPSIVWAQEIDQVKYLTPSTNTSSADFMVLPSGELDIREEKREIPSDPIEVETTDPSIAREFASADAAASSAISPGSAFPQMKAIGNEAHNDPTQRFLNLAADRKYARLEAVFQVLNVVDAVETLTFLSKKTAHEKNFILGKNPSPAAVIGYKAAIGLGHMLISQRLQRAPKSYRNAWHYGFILGTGLQVGLNLKYVM